MADPFRIQMARISRKVGDRADTLLRAVSLETLTRIVQRTPVDTGRARGGWEVARNTRPKDSSSMDASGGATIAKASAMISGAKSGDTISIRNNVPYIRKLEFGRSAQAAAGMVRVTVLEIRSMIARALARMK